MIFELKTADSYYDMEMAAQTAMKQMKEKHYGNELSRDGYSALRYYGIAFYKKNCCIMAEECKI